MNFMRYTCHAAPSHMFVDANRHALVAGPVWAPSCIVRTVRILRHKGCLLLRYGSDHRRGWPIMRGLNDDGIVHLHSRFDHCFSTPCPIIRHMFIPVFSSEHIIFVICSCVAFRCSSNLVITAVTASSFLSHEALFISATSWL
jgi:hypothetical protein